MSKSIWSIIPKNPLPPDIASLPTVTAEHWVTINPDPQAMGLEGPIFDKAGNLYVCHSSPMPFDKSKILKITPEKEISVFCEAAPLMPVGLTVHKDGRIFAACISGEILILNADGSRCKLIEPSYDGTRMAPDDLVFDFKGNLYFTDMRGHIANPIGSVFRLDADGDYEKLTQITGGLCMPNGIAFSPDQRDLWVGETTRNTVTRLAMSADGYIFEFGGVMPVYNNMGTGHPDSMKVDSAGNVYQAMMQGGRILVLNSMGIPVANVLVPDRDEGKNLRSPNLAIKPGTDEAYFVAAGTDGARIFKFTALAEAQLLYSHT